MRIVFMGTPEIAATCLNALVEGGHEIAAVVTGEDKPRGRKMVMTPTAVKAYALERGIPAYTPKTLRDEAFGALLASLAPEVIVVVAYGKILPEAVLRFPKYGCINVHVSLLPKYRGAAPMQRAVMGGERETGVTLMQMDVGLDTGDILMQTAFPIGEEDTFETVHDTSARLGGEMLCALLPKLERGEITPVKQDDALATYAAKIEKSDCHIDFQKTAAELNHLIRGVNPIPMAFCLQGERMLKIVRAVPVEGKGNAGEVIALSEAGDGSITVACGTGALAITHLIPEGKGRMTAADYIRGRKIQKGDFLS